MEAGNSPRPRRKPKGTSHGVGSFADSRALLCNCCCSELGVVPGDVSRGSMKPIEPCGLGTLKVLRRKKQLQQKLSR